jgi:glycosyltransferase involved in cell wall biosynthesis
MVLSMEFSGGSSPSEPLVSVVIPVYNRAHVVGRAVRSAFEQSYQNFEIIVVDDASNDELGNALAPFADSRLSRIAHSHNRGAAAARNTGIAAARGEFVAFLDSDDVWLAEKLAFQVTAMRDPSPMVAGHVCAYECVKAGYGVRRIMPDWTAKTFARRQLFGCTCGPGTTLLCRREVFADIGPFDEELRRLEDWDWILRLAAKGYLLSGSPIVLARVDVGANAARRDVEAAVERIRTRHDPTKVYDGNASRRIFEASLYLESAAAAFGAKAYARALNATLHSLLRYPLRGSAFYWRVAGRMSGASRLTTRRAHSPAASRSVR